MLAGDDDAGLAEAFDVVVDTTGHPAGLERALRLARREVHLKSTHGQPSAGVRHLTELVVDELSLAPLPARAAVPRVAWLGAASPEPGLVGDADLAVGEPAALVSRFASGAGLPHADAAVVDSVEGFERAVRPVPGVERPLVRPRGVMWLHPAAETGGSVLLAAVRDRGLRLSSSRCGDFRLALAMLATPALRGVGRRFVTHRFDAARLSEAFEVAQTRGCVKAVVQHAPAVGR